MHKEGTGEKNEYCPNTGEHLKDIREIHLKVTPLYTFSWSPRRDLNRQPTEDES
jgi:hypothetical protein